MSLTPRTSQVEGFPTEAQVFEKLTKQPNPTAIVAAFEAGLISEKTLFKLLPQGHPILVQSALSSARVAVQRLTGPDLNV